MSKGKITPKNILHGNKKKQEKITLENLLEVASSEDVYKRQIVLMVK